MPPIDNTAELPEKDLTKAPQGEGAAPEEDDEDDDLEEGHDSEEQGEGQASAAAEAEGEGDADPAAGEESEDPESRRLRRAAERRERKQRMREAREAQNRLIESLTTTNQTLQQRLDALERRASTSDSAQIDAAINSSTAAYRAAEVRMAKAMKAGDENTFIASLQARDEARDRLNQLQGLKQRVSGQDPMTRRQPTIEPVVLSHANAFMARNKWYDPRGKDEDSRIALAIDEVLVADGFNPQTPQYWTELETRLKRRLPHRYAAPPAGGKPKKVAGKPPAMGTPPSGGVPPGKGMVLSKERRQALLDKGLSPGSPEWNKHVNAYKAWDKQQAGKQ